MTPSIYAGYAAAAVLVLVGVYVLAGLGAALILAGLGCAGGTWLLSEV